MTVLENIFDPVKTLNKDRKGFDKLKFYFRDLNNVEPQLVLKVTLDPLLRLCKFTGIFPMQINRNSGIAAYGRREWASLFYLFYLAFYIALSILYSGLYFDLLQTEEVTSIAKVAKYLFVCGQFMAAAITILGMPRICRRTVDLWNKLLVVVTPLCDGDRRAFQAPYWKSRFSIICWILIVSTSWYMWWRSFHVYFAIKFKPISNNTYYLNVGGALCLATLISCHVLPSMMFVLILAIIKASYKTILNGGRPVRKLGIEFSGELDRLGQLVDIFGRLNNIVRKLGEIFGRYLMVEMCALFTALLTNMFGILSGMDNGSVNWETTIMSISVNLIWLYVICEAGEGLQKEQMRCLKALKLWTLSSKSPGSWLVSTMLDETPTGVTAANYFPVSRQLTTQVMGSIVMYLIVMLQFKSNTRPQIDLNTPCGLKDNILGQTQ